VTATGRSRLVRTDRLRRHRFYGLSDLAKDLFLGRSRPKCSAASPRRCRGMKGRRGGAHGLRIPGSGGEAPYQGLWRRVPINIRAASSRPIRVSRSPMYKTGGVTAGSNTTLRVIRDGVSFSPLPDAARCRPVVDATGEGGTAPNMVRRTRRAGGPWRFPGFLLRAGAVATDRGITRGPHNAWIKERLPPPWTRKPRPFDLARTARFGRQQTNLRCDDPRSNAGPAGAQQRTSANGSDLVDSGQVERQPHRGLIVSRDDYLRDDFYYGGHDTDGWCSHRTSCPRFT